MHSERATPLLPQASPTARSRHRAAMRSRILRAAREIFFRDGFNAASLDEIVGRAEIGKGTLYRHFESKAEIYVAVLAENGVGFEERMLEELQRAGSAISKIRTVGLFYRRYWIEHPAHFGIFWAVHSQAFIGELSRPLLDDVTLIWERPLRVLERILAEGVASGELRVCDPWVMANVIWRAGNSAVEALITPRKFRIVDCPPEAIYRETLDLILTGLAPIQAD